MALVALALVACDRKEADEGADDLIAWLKANPSVSEATWRNAGVLVCRPKSGQSCGRKSCVETEPKVFARWTPAAGTYERCDADGSCQSFRPQISYSGSWTNIALPENGMLARVTASGEYTEVATIMDSVLVYHGQCERKPL